MSVHEDHRSLTAADITAILARNCGLDPDRAAADTSASLAELGMDSLAVLELQAVVADTYHVRIPDDAVALSIPAIVEFVDKQHREA